MIEASELKPDHAKDLTLQYAWQGWRTIMNEPGWFLRGGSSVARADHRWRPRWPWHTIHGSHTCSGGPSMAVTIATDDPKGPILGGPPQLLSGQKAKLMASKLKFLLQLTVLT